MSNTSSPRLVSLLLLGLAVATPTARADHGASDARVSLPDGPGSIGGVGDNVQLDANMGSMNTTVEIEVPPGYEGNTPGLALQYSSSSGSGEVGYGWSLPVSSIERMRLRGLPVYDDSDEIVVDGGGELVRTGVSSGSAEYRARFEGAFVRYRWHERDGGAAGYWTAERPDGTIAYYGADETGSAVRAARVETPEGYVYRWHLVAEVDRFGHAIRYAYAKDGEYSLVDEISYAHDASGSPLYSVRFAYEARPDAITTGEPGFLLALRQRLSEVRVLSGPETIRRYLLSYEDLATSGGASRLASVDQRGRGDAPTPIRFTYAYSRSLDGSCSGSCDGAFMVDMGNLPAGVDLRSGRATLIDMNGDALPDILSTSTDGRHTIVPARIDPETGVPSFGAAYPSAATTSGTAFVLSAPGVQVLDVDGDGFTDIIESRNGNVLCNTGTGDWGGSSCLMNSTLPVLEDDGDGDANPRYVRFLDYDDDRRIDIIRTLPGSTEVFVNTGEAFVSHLVEDIGAQFDVSPTLQLADLNGDGLQDPVEILTGATQLRYRLNLGYGRWTTWETASLIGFGGSDLELMQLEDINGDGMADVVLVAGNEVRYAVNRGDHFDPAVTVTSADVTGDVPERVTDSTVVLFADMNGSGSRDVVWVTGSRVQFLELFPTRPNLISRVENGLGSVQEIAYGSSVLQQARDLGTPDEWTERLPYPVNVVVELDLWQRLTGTEEAGLHDRTTMIYRQGFYDGVERVFRGFANVERLEPADPAIDFEEGSRTTMAFDVGVRDPYRAGRLLQQAVFEGAPGAWAPVRETRITHEDCPVSDVPTSGLRLPVRHVCETAREETFQEGAPEDEWATTRVETTYDGYGQVTRSANLGVVYRGSPSAPIGCGECAAGACGAQCLGDEEVIETSYVEPGSATGGAWILGREVRVLRHDGAGGPRAETVSYYDGPDFMGLPEGTLTRGALTSRRTRISAGDEWIWAIRVRHDAHGNVVEAITPRGAVHVTDDHRRHYTYDAEGLRLVREEVSFRDGAGEPSVLRRETAYEAAFGEPAMQTAWMLVRGGSVVTARNPMRVRYDAFGRPDARYHPGDPDAAPTEEFSYELGDPVSRIIVRSRSTLGGALDTEEIQCLDGLGRQVQTRARIGPNDYQVSKYVEMNRRGRVIREYWSYRSTSAECDATAPSVPHVQYTYDSQERPKTISYPDEAVHGSRSLVTYEYSPLVTSTFDAEDTDESSPHARTPSSQRHDGLGRVIEMTRDLGDGQIGTTTLNYDGLGHLASVVDPLGETHEQTYDLAGRVLTATDPSTGTTRFRLDEAGNVVERTDARGGRVLSEYDALGRVLAHWDPEDEEATRTTFVYDRDESCDECGSNGAGQLVTSIYPTGALGTGRDEVGHDPRGRPAFQARTLGGQRFVMRYEHDAIGKLLRSTLPGGIVLERSYDGLARPTSIEGVVDDITYHPHGDIDTLFYANGARTTRTYDASLRVERLETRSGGIVLQGARYERDRIGNIRAMHDVSDPSKAGPGLGASFGYDAWYRLTNAAFGGADGEVESLEVDYDLGHRVLRRESSLGAASRAHVGTFEYDERHPERVVRAGTRTYRYDAAGNVTERGSTALAWDHVGRLVSARGSASGEGAYLYGAGSDRVAKLEDGGATLYLTPEVEVRDGIVSVHPRVGAWRVARLRTSAIQAEVLSDVAPLNGPEGEINAADAWVAHAAGAGIVSGPEDASDPMQLLRGAARRLLTLDGGDLRFLHHDHLGSITLATDESGAEAGETLYYPNGEVRYRSGFTDEHGFTGQEADSSSGLLAFKYRYLDTGAGRWASADPAFAVLTPEDVQERLTDATSLYAYAGNQLMNALDPDGLTGQRAGRSRVGNALNRLSTRVRHFASRAKNAVWKHHGKILTVASIVGQAALGNVLGAGVNAVVAAGGWMLGGKVRSLMVKHNITLGRRGRTLLRATSRLIMAAVVVGAVTALVTGTTIVTGGGALIAGAAIAGAWSVAQGLGTASIVSNVSAASDGLSWQNVASSRWKGHRRNIERADAWAETRREQFRPDPSYIR